MATRPAGFKPAAAKPPAAGIKPSGAKPPAPGINKLAASNPQRAISPPNSARANGSNPQRAVSPPSASNGRAPLEHKNSQVGLGRPTSDPKNKASYGTIIRNWNNAPASKANLAMLEKKNLLPLTLLHRHNNVKVQSVASEVIDSLIELSDGSIGMDPSKVNGFRPLVELCKRDGIDPEIPVLVVQSLAHLAAHQNCRAPILGEVGWFNIPQFARSKDDDMKIACALLIGNLSHEVANQKSIIEKGVPLLQENLKDAKTPELRAAFLSAFADVSQIKEYGAQEIWDQSLLKYVFPPIKTGSNREEMFAAVSLLCNICDTPTISVHKEIVDGGVVDKLYELLKSDSDEMQANVALIFARLGKSSVGRQKLESLPSFKNLIDRLLSKVPITQFQVAGALDVLADSDAIKKILKKEDCVEVLQEIILSSSGHAQVEELSLSVLKKLDADRWKVVAEKHANKVRAQAESAPEETLQFSPRRRDSSPPEPKNLKPAASDIPQPRSRTSVKMQPLQSLTPSSMDADRMQKDHQMEVQKLQEEKKRLEELLRKEREAERESSKYTAVSPGSNIDDKIKGSLKSIQESINLEVDLLGDERRKIEEWKRAIENFRGERIIYEKDLEIFRKDKEHQAKEKEQLDKEKQTLQVETDKIEKDKKNLNSENDKLEKERAKLQEELAALAKSREKLQKEKEEFEKERENERAAFNGKVELSSLDKERADREREKAEKAEKEREKMEQERDEAEKERKRLEQLLESERQKYKQELEEEKRRREEEERKREEERERNAKGSKSEEALIALQNDYEEITLKFEKEKKKFEREKEQMQAEIDILKESNGKKSSSKLSELQRMINVLEENLEESQKTNKILEDKVESLEEELKRLRAESNMSDNQLQAELEEERRRSEELAKKLAEAQEELERRDNDDLDERQRKQLAEDLKKIEEWEKAKEREKIENQKKLDEEIEFLKQRHASWERKQAIAMADLIEKEKALYDKEADLKKYDDDLYERETKVHDAESRPSGGRDYSDSDRSYSDDDSYSRRDDWSDDDGSGDDRTLSLSSSSEDITIDSPRKKPSRDKDREQREREQRERERERLEREREEKQKRLSQKASSPKPKSPKPGTPNIRPKSGLKSSSGLRSSEGVKPATPKPRPPIDYMDTLDDLDDDDDDLFSVEGLAQSDPYEAARKLLALLELDPSRSTEADLATLKKFAKNRSGAPTQYEARDIIPTLIHILRVCTDPSHEEIINTCLLILAILAYNKDANQLYIRRAQGGPLFEIFLSFSIVSVKARAALAIAAYCLNNVSIKNEMGQTAVATLCTMLKDADPVIKKSASTALASLVDNNKYNKKIMKKQGGVKTLLDLMRDNQIPAKYSLHLLASLAHDSKSIKKDVPKHFPNVFRKIILLLSPFTKPSVLAAAVASLMELARNSPANQKAIWKAKATNYLVTILINKDRYNNDDLIANTLFLCWVIARISPKGLADKEFYDPKWSMADILKTLKDTNNEVIKKIIYQMENMIRTADVAGKGEKGERERKGERPSPTPPPASPALSSSSPALSSSSGINNKNNNNNDNNNNNNNTLSSSSRLSASVTLSSSGAGPSRATPSPQPAGPSK